MPLSSPISFNRLGELSGSAWTVRPVRCEALVGAEFLGDAERHANNGNACPEAVFIGVASNAGPLRTDGQLLSRRVLGFPGLPGSCTRRDPGRKTLLKEVARASAWQSRRRGGGSGGADGASVPWRSRRTHCSERLPRRRWLPDLRRPKRQGQPAPHRPQDHRPRAASVRPHDRECFWSLRRKPRHGG